MTEPRRRSSGDSQLVVDLDTPLPSTIATGGGNQLFLRGRCYHLDERIKRLRVTVDDLRHAVVTHSVAVPDVLRGTVPIDPRGHVLTSGFWARIPIPAAHNGGAVDVGLEAELANGSIERASIGVTVLVRDVPRTRLGPVAKIAICSAVADPPLALLRERARSFEQWLDDWLWIIVDDLSPRAKADALTELGNHPRVRVVRNEARLGPVASLERALASVPDGTAIAAIDPGADDSPTETFAAAVTALERIGVDAVLGAPPSARADLASTLLDAPSASVPCVFNASLLDTVLPFPPDAGVFDATRWVASVAISTGRGAITLGPPNVAAARRRTPASRAWTSRKGARRALAAAARRSTEHVSVLLAQAALSASTLRMRGGLPTRTLARVGMADKSAIALLLATRRPGMVLPLLTMRLLTMRFRSDRARSVARTTGLEAVRDTGLEPRLAKIEFDMSPLPLSVSPTAAERVNVLVPMIDFRYVFGAYLMIFHLVLALRSAGRRVRILVVQEPTESRDRWVSEIRRYPGLESLLERVEIEDVADRSGSVDVSPNDVFLATTSWTAHVAAAASRELKRDRFPFLIMEYDPLVFPTGTRHVLSASAYDLPHDAIFSTEMLRRYFSEERLGVFMEGQASGEDHSVVIDNPVDVHDVGVDTLRGRRPRRVLFYARPEEHAQRNLFEIGVLALRTLVARRAADLGGWSFEGIGSLQPFEVSLGGGVVLDVRSRVTLDAYLEMLRSYDVGLALQATPHPGLVALDMAAAGIVTVTNTFATKRSEDITAISSNLIAPAPTIDAVADALSLAIDRAEDADARVRGSDLAWPRSWDEALTESVLDRLLALPSLRRD